MASPPFETLRAHHYGAILADPAWRFETWSDKGRDRTPDRRHYSTMGIEDIRALPVRELAANDSILFLWVTWWALLDALSVIEAWGFTYKTCAFNWTKADATQVELFQDDIEPVIGTGKWTRANTEPCLLATCGKPKRINADVRQAIIEPRREHSRKPVCVHERIERLVAGPYVELFARQRRADWDCWGDQVNKFSPVRATGAAR
jgi:N6-adenosine-specific RNA methylase IME4